MPKYMTPEVVALLKEFLEDAVDQTQNDATKERWTKREDLARSMKEYVEATDAGVADGVWHDEAANYFPEARYWQFALFRVCARRSLRRMELIEEGDILHSNKMFGRF